MSDIVERLRETFNRGESGLLILNEAAAEIERLKTIAFEADDKRCHLQAEIERLQTGWELATKAIDENTRLRTALREIDETLPPGDILRVVTRRALEGKG